MRIVLLTVLLIVVNNCRRLETTDTRSDRSSERQISRQAYLIKLRLDQPLRSRSSEMQRHGDPGCSWTTVEHQQSGLVVVRGDVSRKVRAKRNGKTVVLTKVEPTVTSQLTSNLTPISGNYNKFTLPLYIKQLQVARAGLGEEIAYEFIHDDTNKKMLLKIEKIEDNFTRYELSATIDDRRFDFMHFRFSQNQQIQEIIRKMPGFLTDEPDGVTVKLELKATCKTNSKDGEPWQGLITTNQE